MLISFNPQHSYGGTQEGPSTLSPKTPWKWTMSKFLSSKSENESRAACDVFDPCRIRNGSVPIVALAFECCTQVLLFLGATRE